MYFVFFGLLEFGLILCKPCRQLIDMAWCMCSQPCNQGQPWELWGLGQCKKIRPFILKKKKNHWKITLHMVCDTKLLIKLLYSVFSNKSCSIDNMANQFNLFLWHSWLKDFYNFNFEKLLLTDATVTGIVNNILYAIDTLKNN